MIPGDRRAARNACEFTSPDVDALIRRQVHLVARLNVERLVPGIDVSNDAVDAILGGAVLIGQQLSAKSAFALLGFPAVAISDEKALVAGQAIDQGRFAVVGDIFAIG